ncbi:kinase-like domain-containing protein [Pelagophyceae sp. CCMP2097]|nr:kinase-like domain-containing protein [Pelagophyceae sp. CCMP2097]|mmetsp:Transcript_3029/g.9067  ORF Transcript_3029/g.9067 Transcript_3029/m.9067 type:complete len:461 (-) Transcript_3029:177-1559(-)
MPSMVPQFLRRKSESKKDATRKGAGKAVDGEVTVTRELKRYNVMGVRFDVDVRYSVLDVVGQGAYGVVCAAHDELTGQAVAIKKISNAFEHVTYTKRTLREVRLLRLLQHENIIGLRTLLPPVKSDGFKDLYIISDLMETDLSSIIKSPQALSDDHVQFFVYQLLRGLKFLHSATPPVTHRDLKPRNLLVNSNCDLKICDFGLARVDFEQYDSRRGGREKPKPRKARASAMTDYVATRWYRAPEIITGWAEYTKAIDMWAVGCVLAELLGRKPLLPGSDSQHQLELICQLLGPPAAATVAKIETREIREYLASIPRTRTRPFAELYPAAAPKACDLLAKLLVFEPAQRLDVEAALEQPYLDQLHFAEDEPRGPDIPRDAFAFEFRDHISIDDLKEEIVHEIWCFHYDESKKLLSPSNAQPFSGLHETYKPGVIKCEPKEERREATSPSEKPTPRPACKSA